MGVFIDTSVFVALRNKRDKNHSRAVSLMEGALQSKYGIIYTSNYVIDETITTALIRSRDHKIAVDTGRFILDSPRIEKLAVGAEEFAIALEKFKKYGKKLLSFTDCTSLSLIDRHRIHRIMSFDSDFDGLASRIY